MSTILLVDDDPDILKLVAMRLAAAGHGVREAESGERALALLAASRPDLVITDLKMDGIDGLTLFDEIRKQAPTLLSGPNRPRIAQAILFLANSH